MCSLFPDGRALARIPQRLARNVAISFYRFERILPLFVWSPKIHVKYEVAKVSPGGSYEALQRVLVLEK